MPVSYDKLWKLMKANKMKKLDLAKAAGLSSYMMNQLGKDEYVSLEVIAKLCKVFHCDVGDVVEFIED
ncbi:helix-turn-helix domain-containing protein [Macellibacteroides fermentans]|uniref:helix-turn-helix domain-containing protein n=1 Tax=Macellibacteroides fermentans TaxID=879969 RepID=UPI00406BE935